MASSDEEEETVPESVTNYYFVDKNDDPISFSVLPVQWEDRDIPEAENKEVFLHGTASDGLQKIYKPVVAWKMELENQFPEVWVLSMEKRWIKLLKPRKSFEDTIRKILITLQCLHYLKRNPDSSEKSLWDHLRKVFSHYEVRASQPDLSGHLPLMQKWADRDETLAKSKLLLMFLEENSKKRKHFSEDLQNDQNPDFINDNEDVDEQPGDASGDGSDEDWSDCFDSVCAICDNGGELLCCEGRCLRSFHATRDAGQDSECKTLGYTRKQVHEIQNFMCSNCQYKQHQCFACGKLGSSDKSSSAEVFRCVSATCGHFYHPQCVAKLLHPENEVEATELERKISDGESFTCPVHKCIVCKQGENKEVEELQFAICRRCPKSYHRKCLPRRIAFEEIEEEDIIQRAWDDLIPKRILIYCLKHKIDEDLGTPIRNHIVFPEIAEKKKPQLLVKRKTEDMSNEKPSTTLRAKLYSSADASGLMKKSEKSLSGQAFDLFKKPKTPGTSLKHLKDSSKYSVVRESKISVREEKTKPAVLNKELLSVKSVRKDLSGSSIAKTVSPTSSSLMAKVSSSSARTEKKTSSSLPVIDKETEKKIMAIVRSSPSNSLTLEEFMKRKEMPSTHAYSARHVDKAITQGKVEGSIEAIRAALKKLEDGCSIEDAKAVCGADILFQIIKWRNKLRVYLSPFLHGLRYTSFGRHFTKVDKLKEIVDKLHWYVQNGDMIVDFCCGSNDFSLIVKEKLEATGKKCFYRNYDVIQPKNDFNFFKKDWMKVHPKDLPTGSQLIMGLNPPFGVKASLANKFIDKALEFKPKLLILIVPTETERLDEKKARYDLIWEDGEKLSGKSFYLPGSIDVNDKQIEQWNVKPPFLYLWSRPDWTAKHKAIATKHGHTSNALEVSDVAEPNDVPAEQIEQAEGYEAQAVSQENKGSPPQFDSAVGGSHRNDGKRIESTSSEKKRPLQNSKKRARRRNKSKRTDETSGGRKDDELSDMSISPRSQADPINLVEGHLPFEGFGTPSERTGNLGGFSRSGSEFGATYGGVQSSSLPNMGIDEIEKRYTSMPTSGIGGFNYSGIQASEERFPRHIRDSGSDGFGWRSHIDRERPIGLLDIHSNIQLYGQQDPDDLSQRSRYSLGGASSGFAHTSAFSSSYDLSSSAMQRYAPRLDEMNHLRREPIMSGPLLPGRSSMGSVFDGPGSRTGLPPDSTGYAPGSSMGSVFDGPGSRTGLPPDSTGYAPGSRHPFSHSGTSGWLNE